jgi:hypothetical protein
MNLISSKFNARLVASIAFLALLILFTCTKVMADGNVSHAYKTTDNISNGDIVSLQIGSNNTAQLANRTSSNRLLGVAVTPNSSLLVINPEEGSVQVVVSGSTKVLASTIDGPIQIGDQISVSPLDGIGMKANYGYSVVGVATSNLSSSSKNHTTVKDVVNSNGKKIPVTIGYVNLTISLNASLDQGTGVSSRLQNITERITGKTVSVNRIIISLIILIISVIALFVLIYTSIYSSIMSIGRNPLAKQNIIHSLYFVLVAAIFIAALAAISIFLLLD